MDILQAEIYRYPSEYTYGGMPWNAEAEWLISGDSFYPAELRGPTGPWEQPVTTIETPAGATLLRFLAGSQGVPTTTYPLKQKSMD